MEEVKIQGGKVLDACNKVQIQVVVLVIFLILTICEKLPSEQGGRSWQPFVGSKNGHKNFRQARI